MVFYKRKFKNQIFLAQKKRIKAVFDECPSAKVAKLNFWRQKESYMIKFLIELQPGSKTLLSSSKLYPTPFLKMAGRRRRAWPGLRVGPRAGPTRRDAARDGGMFGSKSSPLFPAPQLH